MWINFKDYFYMCITIDYSHMNMSDIQMKYLVQFLKFIHINYFIYIIIYI